MCSWKLFIGGLSWESNEDSLRAYFGAFGRVSDCVIMRDRHSGHPRGFGFVSYDDEATADRVAADRHELDGRQVEAKRAVPRSECTPAARVHARATKKVFVGGLPGTCADREFYEYFARFGEVAESQIMYDFQTRNSRGFGFVTFAAETTVDRVVNMDHDIMGKMVEVKRAEPKQALEARRNSPPTGVDARRPDPPAARAPAHAPPPAPPAAPAAAAAAAAAAAFAHADQQHHLLIQAQADQAAQQAQASLMLQRQHLQAAVPPRQESLFAPFAPTTPSAWAASPPPAAGDRAAATAAPASLLHLHELQLVRQQQQQRQQQESPARTKPELGAPDAATALSLSLQAPPGIGYFSPASQVSPDLVQCAHSSFYGASFPLDAHAFGAAADVTSAARADRRLQPYSLGHERVERSYR